MSGRVDTLARREAIRRLLLERPIATQEELAERLAEEGIDATQATLSRDLAYLGAVRAARPEGGTVYALEPLVSPLPGGRRDLGLLVLSIEENGHLVVMRTGAGAASAVARAVDLARLPDCLGTVAGDDTIFAAPSKGRSARRLADKLRQHFGKEAQG